MTHSGVGGMYNPGSRKERGGKGGEEGGEEGAGGSVGAPGMRARALGLARSSSQRWVG